MSEAVAKASPLARFRLDAPVATPRGAPGIVAWERAFLGHLNLRSRHDDLRFVAAVAEVLGMPLPIAPNTVAVGPEAIAYWLGPDEWLLVTAGESERAIAAALREALSGVHSAVTEIGSGQTAIVLEGNAVRELLSKGCPLDLDTASFKPDACAQTRLAKTAVLLRPLQAGAMEVIVRRSFADYLWSWIVDAAAEYGFRATAAPVREASMNGGKS